MKQFLLIVACVLIMGVCESEAKGGHCDARATAYVKDANGEYIGGYFDSKDFGYGHDERACTALVENWFDWFEGQGCVWFYQDGAAQVVLYATYAYGSPQWYVYAGPRGKYCD